MFRLFRVVKEEGEAALRRTVWMLCAALFLIVAVGFAATAAAFALSATMPMWAALMISAGGVFAVGLICLVIADREHHSQSSAPMSASPDLNFLNSGLIDRTTQAMLLNKVKTRPASVLAIAAAAGLAVAALDAFDDD